ncbi:hypothetical protein R3P38DRAFT_3243362 [Favolaschia claudopus]|uniref:Uncharacterized protein n=1 Tax=Favolaschia claudopus TaxID=2862362 RepID=A0AAV9Z338_9AGAR
MFRYHQPLSPSPTSFPVPSSPISGSPLFLFVPPPAISSPDLYTHVLSRGFGRRQANPALQLASTRQHRHPVRGLSLLRLSLYRISSAEQHLQRFSPGILPPAGKNRTLDFKAAAFHRASRALRLVDDAPRSGAYRFEYMEIIPASGTSRYVFLPPFDAHFMLILTTFARGISPPAGKPHPSGRLQPAGFLLTSRAFQLVEDAPRSGA